MTSGTTNYLHGVWGTSSSNVFAVGESGTILHYSGPQLYEVTFDTDPESTGTITFDGVIYNDGDIAAKPAGTYNITANTATGYAFTRWETTGDISVANANSATTTCTVTGNGTLRMVQTAPPSQYTVTYNANGGTNPPIDSNKYTDGQTVIVLGPGSMMRTSYTFSKWNTKADGLGTPYNPGDTFEIHSNITLYAQWIINSYTLTTGVSPTGSGSVSLSPPGGTYAYTTPVQLTATPTSGYRFGSWSGDLTGTSNPATIIMNTDKSVTANFIKTYIITAMAGSGGSISPSGAVIVDSGSNQTFTITPNAGYYIKDVLVDGTSAGTVLKYTFTNVIKDHTIEAQFMKQLDLTPPSLTLPTINGVNLDMPNSLLQINTSTLTFTVQASDESGIARMVVKVNGVVQIDKNNLDPTITLNEGMNTVEVTVYDIYGNYATKSFKVLKDTEGPTIILPSDLPQTVSSNTFTLKGTVIDSASGISTLMVNNHSIAVTLDGNFELQLTLTQGTNTILIEAADKLGNKTTKTVTISYTQSTSQSKTSIITLKVGDPHININGIEKNIDVQGSKPIIENDRTLVPIRVLIESLGGTVEWDNTQRKVTINLGYKTIELLIGKNTAKVNGVNTPIDSTNSKVVPEIINDRTYLPLRFICENLGAVVDWDNQTQTITIYYFR
jgi:hypothetical protein